MYPGQTLEQTQNIHAYLLRTYIVICYGHLYYYSQDIQCNRLRTNIVILSGHIVSKSLHIY